MGKKAAKGAAASQRDGSRSKPVRASVEENLQSLINIKVPVSFNHLSAAMVKPKPHFADDRTTTAFFAELKGSAEAGAMTSRA